MGAELVDLVTGLDFWGWWILGVVLAAIEILAPGMVFLWLGTSAIVVGLVLAAFPGMDWRVQWFLFAVLSVASVIAARVWLRRHPLVSDHPTLNRRGEAMIGRVLVLSDPIQGGRGRVRIGDSTWGVEGPDLPAGTRIRIASADGAVLRIEAAPEG